MKDFVFLALIGIFLIVGMVSHTYMHELVHVQNFKASGVASHVEYSLTGALTVPENNFANNEIAEQVNLQNSINEAVGYNVTPLAFMICAVLVVCTIYLKGDKQ